MKTEILIHDLSRKVAPVRPLPHPLRRYIYWLCFAVPFVAIGAFWIGVRSDVWTIILESHFVLQMMLLLFFFLTTSLSAFFLGAPDIRNRHYILFSGVVIVGGFLMFIVSLLHGPGNHSGTGWKCVRNILFLCIPPAGLSYYLLSIAYPLKKNFAGLFAFLGASALACLATRVICPNDNVTHFFIWHYTPALILGGVGFILGRFFFAKRGFK